MNSSPCPIQLVIKSIACPLKHLRSFSSPCPCPIQQHIKSPSYPIQHVIESPSNLLHHVIKSSSSCSIKQHIKSSSCQIQQVINFPYHPVQSNKFYQISILSNRTNYQILIILSNPTVYQFFILSNSKLFKSSSKIVSEYDQEMPQSQTADNPFAPRGRAAQPSRDTRKTN